MVDPPVGHHRKNPGRTRKQLDPDATPPVTPECPASQDKGQPDRQHENPADKTEKGEIPVPPQWDKSPNHQEPAYRRQDNTAKGFEVSYQP